MPYVLGALGGLVGGFIAGELVAVVIGVVAHLAFGADLPFALKLMPFYLALAGAIGIPLLLSRRARRPDGTPPGHRPDSPYGDTR